MKCQLSIGESFRDWLVEELISSIRKTDQYKLEKLFNEKLAIKEQLNIQLLEKVFE
jgi:prophage antirepressor-like protein